MLKGNQIRIGVIDDDEDDFFIIKDYLHEIENVNFVIDWINSYKTAIDKIKNNAYHLYFLDYRLGNETGLELLQEATAMQCDRPIVLLTGKGNKAIDIKAMQSGATDYLVKSDLNTEKLERCIRYSLDRAASLRELKERENKYRNLFKGSKDAVFIADQNLFFTECNHAATVLFGLGSEELLRHSFLEFVAGEAHKAKIVRLINREEELSDMEIQIHTSNDETKRCLLSFSLKKNSHPHHFIH